MYIKISSYNKLYTSIEEWDTVSISPTGDESAGIEEGQYGFEGMYDFECLYSQFKDFKNKLSEVDGWPQLDIIDIGSVIGPAVVSDLYKNLRAKSFDLINKWRDDDSFMFMYAHILNALEHAKDKGVIIIS